MLVFIFIKLYRQTSTPSTNAWGHCYKKETNWTTFLAGLFARKIIRIWLEYQVWKGFVATVILAIFLLFFNWVRTTLSADAIFMQKFPEPSYLHSGTSSWYLQTQLLHRYQLPTQIDIYFNEWHTLRIVTWYSPKKVLVNCHFQFGNVISLFTTNKLKNFKSW